MSRNFIYLAAILLLGIGSSCSNNAIAQEVIESGARLEKLAGGFSFTEGPTSDARGNVYFTDQPNDRIMKWSLSGELTAFLQPSGRSNGLSFDSKGVLWACADEKNEFWQIDQDKKVAALALRYDSRLLNGPNDLWINEEGGIYFTDPYYQRPWWSHKSMPQDLQGVFYLAPDHKTLKRVADDLVQPNGIVGTPDGKTLFVADIGANKTWRYTINEDQSLGNKILFCELGSDGMTIDIEGNVYLTGDGVTIFDKNGKQIGHIAVPESWTANVCFGGADMTYLYITASKGLYRIRTRVAGTKG
jgi:gluconolactonase